MSPKPAASFASVPSHPEIEKAKDEKWFAPSRDSVHFLISQSQVSPQDLPNWVSVAKLAPPWLIQILYKFHLDLFHRGVFRGCKENRTRAKENRAQETTNASPDPTSQEVVVGVSARDTTISNLLPPIRSEGF